MIIPGYVGFFDEMDLPEETLKNPLFLETFFKVQKQLNESRIFYLKALAELESDGLIQSSMMRELTVKGRDLSKDYFSLAKSSLNRGDIYSELELLLFITREVSLCVYLPGEETCDYCEMDIFVHEMADQLHRTYFGEENEILLRQFFGKYSVPPHYLPYLGAIDVMTRCIDKGWLEVNPREIQYADRCTVKFVLPTNKELKEAARSGNSN